MPDRVEVYQRAWDKLTGIHKSLGKCLDIEDYVTADGLMEGLRHYSECHYCQSYRGSFESKGLPGMCGECPLHKVGEELAGHSLHYNGCYRIAPYRNMVRTALWFHENPTRSVLQNVLESLHEAIMELERLRPKLLPAFPVNP